MLRPVVKRLDVGERFRLLGGGTVKSRGAGSNLKGWPRRLMLLEWQKWHTAAGLAVRLAVAADESDVAAAEVK
jgi:hypothetical protein